MKFPRIEVGYEIIFNNTGLDWVDLQDSLCKIVEKEYGVLHCIGKEYYEKHNVGAHACEIKGIQCLFYFKVNANSLKIDVVVIKDDGVVRCKDCKYWDYNNDGFPHEKCRWVIGKIPTAEDYCSYGERKSEDES